MKTGGRKSRGFESHPLRHAGVVAVLGAVLAACSIVGARTFGYSFPDEAGLSALPVLVTDHAGAVVSIDQAPVGLQPMADDGFTPVPGAPNALVIHWTGGACDSKVDIDVQGGRGDLFFSLATTVRPVPCDAVGIPRSILVTLAAPLDPSRTSLVVVKP